MTPGFHIPLIIQLARREIISRYKGAYLGIVWALIVPLVMLAVYTFVFAIVFKVRWGGTALGIHAGKGEFALVLFSGLTLHAFFAECISRAPGLVMENVNYVKRVVFPLGILVPVVTLSALFQYIIGVMVLLGGIFFVTGVLPWTVIFLPVVLAPFLLLTMGVSWLLASLGVFIRDIAQMTGVLTTILLFMSTIFYPAEVLPEVIRPYIYLNPLSYIVDQIRAVALWGQVPDWHGLGVYTIIGLAIFLLGLWWFRKTKKAFADVV